jgi:hypothetical protein
MYIERREANDWPWAREILLADNVHLKKKSLLSASQHHVWVFPLLPERQQKLRMQIVYNGLPKFLGRLLHAYLHPLLGADELSG